MAWPEISIDDFPPERDDEPSSLRQDIIDELSDHFVCALNRELLKNPDEKVARQRVLNQFGDPIKVARQLWLEAMKEKIMSQRILVGISAVMAVCCIAVVGIAWSMMQESRAFNLQMLEQFKQAQERPAGESSGELQPIEFQLVQEGSGDQPAEGFTGTLSKRDGNDTIFTVEAVSDQNGLLDFGKLPWGNYLLTLKAPWGEEMDSLNITTVPGRGFEQTIICPLGVPEKVAMQLHVNWREMPEGEDYYLLCDFNRTAAIRIIEQTGWVVKHSQTDAEDRMVILFDVKNNQMTRCPLTSKGLFEAVDPLKLDWRALERINQGKYGPPAIYLIKKSELSRLSEINSLNEIGVVRLFNDIDWGIYTQHFGGVFISPFKAFEIEHKLLKQLEMQNSSSLKYIDGTFHGFSTKQFATSSFFASTDQPNVWEINIPDLFPITRESGSLSSVR